MGWSWNQDTLISLHLNTFTWKIIHVSKILRQELLNLKTHRLAADLSPLASVCEQLCTWICVLRCEEYSAADKFWTFHFLHQLVQQQFDPCYGHLCASRWTLYLWHQVKTQSHSRKYGEGGGAFCMLPISNNSKTHFEFTSSIKLQTYFYGNLGQTQKKRRCIFWRQIPMQIKRLYAKSLINSTIRLQAAHFHGFVLQSRQHHDAHKVHCKI